MLRNRPPDTFDTLKADLFRAFKPVNYEDHLEVRLRSRQQRTSEPFTDYFYYMLYMCSGIEPNMPEREKINICTAAFLRLRRDSLSFYLSH